MATVMVVSVVERSPGRLGLNKHIATNEDRLMTARSLLTAIIAALLLYLPVSIIDYNFEDFYF